MSGTADLARWWRSLAEEPEPLRPGEKLAAWLLSIFAALTRWPALSRTPWDWDEALFMNALLRYDVADHHPHPPGFPLFIAAAKGFTWLGLDRFHALQAIALIAAVAIVPAVIFLGRELRLPFPVAVISGVVLAFFPNVWFFGGTAFSDVPSMTLVIVAIALLLRGCRSDGALFAGAALLGIAAGFRPQNLLIGFAPAIIVTVYGFRRRWARVIPAAVIGAAIIAVSYGVAAHLSGGWAHYSEAVHLHQQYITKIDSFRSPTRPPLWRVADDFFVRPWRAPLINAIVTLLVAISGIVTLVRRRAGMLVLLATFGPFCLTAWLFLDWLSVSRFSIGYAPLYAFFTADGISLVAAGRRRIEGALAAVLVALMIAWTWPALREVHETISPPYAAVEWLRAHTSPERSTIYVHGSMEPLVQALLPGRPIVMTGDAPPPVTAHRRESDVYVVEGSASSRGALVFARPRGHLVSITRDRYFEVTISRLHQIITFGEGWYDPEGEGTAMWRWMGGRSKSSLPPLHGAGRLSLDMYVPLDVLHTPPTLTVAVNGAIVDRFRAPGATFSRSYVVSSRPDKPNELVIETDGVVNPAARHIIPDARDLGVRLGGIEWSPER